MDGSPSALREAPPAAPRHWCRFYTANFTYIALSSSSFVDQLSSANTIDASLRRGDGEGGVRSKCGALIRRAKRSIERKGGVSNCHFSPRPSEAHTGAFGLPGFRSRSPPPSSRDCDRHANPNHEVAVSVFDSTQIFRIRPMSLGPGSRRGMTRIFVFL